MAGSCEVGVDVVLACMQPGNSGGWGVQGTGMELEGWAGSNSGGVVGSHRKDSVLQPRSTKNSFKYLYQGIRYCFVLNLRLFCTNKKKNLS